MKVAFFVSCDNLYAVELIVLLKSILINSPKFNYPFYVACAKNNLSWDNRREISSVYPVNYLEYNNKEYIMNNKANLKFRSLEMFKIKDVDYVVQLGADCICLNSVDDIIKECEKITDIGMPKEKQRQDMFSSGIMLINKKYLNKEIYNVLLKADYSNIKMFGNDMKLYNCFFKKSIKEIPYRFDALNTEINKHDELKDVIFFHYCHKPRATRGRAHQWIYDLWDKYYNYKLEDIKLGKINKEFM